MRAIKHIRFLALGLILLGTFLATAEAGMMGGTMTGMLAGSDGHNAAGKVTVSSDRVLTLSDIKVDRVPDGRVYLAKDGDYRQGVELGKLKQFTGTVTFAIPAGTDPADFNSVVIWCEKFSVEIGRAYLTEEQS